MFIDTQNIPSKLIGSFRNVKVILSEFSMESWRSFSYLLKLCRNFSSPSHFFCLQYRDKRSSYLPKKISFLKSFDIPQNPL